MVITKKKGNTIGTRLLPAEAERLAAAADKDKRSVSSFIRIAVIEKLDRLEKAES